MRYHCSVRVLVHCPGPCPCGILYSKLGMKLFQNAEFTSRPCSVWVRVPRTCPIHSRHRCWNGAGSLSKAGQRTRLAVRILGIGDTRIWHRVNGSVWRPCLCGSVDRCRMGVCMDADMVRRVVCVLCVVVVVAVDVVGRCNRSSQIRTSVQNRVSRHG